MADGDRPTLTVEERAERGSRATRRLRREGWVPGVVYGEGSETVSFKVGVRDLRLALQAATAVIDLKVGSARPLPVIVKETQQHPVRGEVMHLDLLQVNLRQKIHSTLAVELVGSESAPGVVQGGVLEHVTRELNIEALPGDLPERIDVDVSGLEVAGTLPLSEISPPEGVEFLDDPDETVIATIGAPTALEETDAVEEETELVGEDAEAARRAGIEPGAEGAEDEARGEGS
ncbi:MAG: 50S ribosomal protein L25 [Thermoleophilaceae bacterium]|jgi:large subunit ribosomal protein L25|nr:50S ribosomal protein L25 [Thermoleophilaceae bacterium]